MLGKIGVLVELPFLIIYSFSRKYSVSKSPSLAKRVDLPPILQRYSNMIGEPKAYFTGIEKKLIELINDSQNLMMAKFLV